MTNFISVSTLNKYLKMKFDKDPYLEKVYLTGQVSNFRKRPSHQYFSLKDESSVIQATIWAGVYKSLGFDLEEGMKINVVGKIQVYQPSGQYSIIIEKAEPDGVGVLAVQFEQLKKKLQEEGLFDDRYKKQIPFFPQKIGVITSQSGAVIRDIITTVDRRFPGRSILLFPTKVQGEGASDEISRNIALANQRDDLDLLIVGRGGGSIEDLWAFNEEKTVRAIFESKLPVISSVGHETDTTLSDFVADKRAATPTAAAELATPVSRLDLLNYFKESQVRLSRAFGKEISSKKVAFEHLSQSVIFRQPDRLYEGHLRKVDDLRSNLFRSFEAKLKTESSLFQTLRQGLLALSPINQIQVLEEKRVFLEKNLISEMNHLLELKKSRLENLSDALLYMDISRIVKRGFGLVRNDQGELVTSVRGLESGQLLNIELSDGKVNVEVKDGK